MSIEWIFWLCEWPAYMARSGRPPGWQTGWLTYTKIRSLICYYLRCCLKSNVIVIAPLNCWLKSSHPRDGHPLSPGWSPTIHRTFTQHLQIKDGHQLFPLQTPAKRPLKLLWNTLEKPLKLKWNTLELPWSFLKTLLKPLKTFLQLLWNILETPLKQFWNTLETFLKYTWN